MAINIEQVKDYVASNIHVVNTIEDIAVELHVSVVTLRKTFSRAEGVSLSEFIRRRKIENMKQFVRTTDMNCAEICYAVGWRPDSGARAFKRSEGMTMMEYRRRSTLDTPEQSIQGVERDSLQYYR